MLSVHFKVAPFRGQIKLKLNTQIGPFYRFNSNFSRSIPNICKCKSPLSP